MEAQMIVVKGMKWRCSFWYLREHDNMKNKSTAAAGPCRVEVQREAAAAGAAKH